jgi:hypothetical protein
MSLITSKTDILSSHREELGQSKLNPRQYRGLAAREMGRPPFDGKEIDSPSGTPDNKQEGPKNKEDPSRDLLRYPRTLTDVGPGTPDAAWAAVNAARRGYYPHPVDMNTHQKFEKMESEIRRVIASHPSAHPVVSPQAADSEVFTKFDVHDKKHMLMGVSGKSEAGTWYKRLCCTPDGRLYLIEKNAGSEAVRLTFVEARSDGQASLAQVIEEFQVMSDRKGGKLEYGKNPDKP